LISADPDRCVIFDLRIDHSFAQVRSKLDPISDLRTDRSFVQIRSSSIQQSDC